MFSVALNEELVGGWLSCNFMVPAQVSSHLSGAFDGHHRPYVVNLKLCHDLWDDFFVVLGQGGAPQKCGSWCFLFFLFGTFSEMGGKMLPKVAKLHWI